MSGRGTLSAALAALCLLVLLASATTPATAAVLSDNGLTVLVPAHKDECFTEIAEAENVKMFLHYMVTSGGSLDIECVVTSPDKKVIWKSDRDSEGRVLFKSRVAGPHTVCFSNKKSSSYSKLVAFSIQVGDGSEVAVSGTGPSSKPDPLQATVTRIHKGMMEIQEIQTYLKVRERVHRATTEVANTRIVLWSAAEVFVVVAMAIGNVWYLRRMFESRRVV